MKHLSYAFDSKNQVWRYIVVITLAIAIANTIGSIPLLIIIFYGAFQKGDLNSISTNKMDFSVYGVDQNIGLASVLFVFFIALIGFILLLKPFHNRTLTGTINGTNKIRWNRILDGLIFWSILVILSFVVSYFLDKELFHFQFKWSKFVPLFFISLVLIPFQTSFEEITIRGYLMQGFATKTHSRIWALILTSIIFGLLHSFNPEVKEYGFFATMPSYIGFGVIFGLITLLDDGVELAIGIHTANNFLSAIIVTNPHSALVTDAVFIVDNINPYVDMIMLFIFGIIILLFFTQKYKWNWKILTQKIEMGSVEIK